MKLELDWHGYCCHNVFGSLVAGVMLASRVFGRFSGVSLPHGGFTRSASPIGAVLRAGTRRAPREARVLTSHAQLRRRDSVAGALPPAGGVKGPLEAAPPAFRDVHSFSSDTSSAGTPVGIFARLDRVLGKEAITVHDPDFNRWRSVPASFAVQLSIGSVYVHTRPRLAVNLHQ